MWGEPAARPCVTQGRKGEAAERRMLRPLFVALAATVGGAGLLRRCGQWLNGGRRRGVATLWVLEWRP